MGSPRVSSFITDNEVPAVCRTSVYGGATNAKVLYLLRRDHGSNMVSLVPRPCRMQPV